MKTQTNEYGTHTKWHDPEDLPAFDKACSHPAVSEIIRERDSDKARLDWLQNEALGASVNATLDDLVGKGWTDLRSAIDNKAKL